MKVLLIIPPYIPSYFNAGHHLPVFQVGEYLRKNIREINVDCVDAAALNIHWRDICTILTRHYDVIGLMNDFDGVDTFQRFMLYVRELSPQSKTFTFGRLSQQIPGFFEQFGFDAIVTSGDYEAGAEDYIKSLIFPDQDVAGVSLKKNGKYLQYSHGRFLEPENWVLPDVKEIPYQAYDFMYANDLDKFCGIPQRRELVVPVARGCPIGCTYCDVPFMQGKKERRLSVDTVVNYIEEAFQQMPFEYVSFYAPTFTLRLNWVKELCTKLIAKGSTYPWKCVTTISHLNEDIIKCMAESGCVRISIGLEALDTPGQSSLPRVKQGTEEAFNHIADVCQRYHIELNCFIILGLPNSSLDGIKYTIETILSKENARVRPTVLTPYYNMRPDMSIIEIGMFNRQTLGYTDLSQEMKAKLYQILFENSLDRPTKVMGRINSNNRSSDNTKISFTKAKTK